MFGKCDFIISNMDMAIDMARNDELKIAGLIMAHAIELYDSCNLLERILIRNKVNEDIKILRDILNNN